MQDLRSSLDHLTARPINTSSQSSCTEDCFAVTNQPTALNSSPCKKLPHRNIPLLGFQIQKVALEPQRVNENVELDTWYQQIRDPQDNIDLEYSIG